MKIAETIKKIAEQIDIKNEQVEKFTIQINELKAELIDTILKSENIKKDLEKIGQYSEQIKTIDNNTSIIRTEIDELLEEIKNKLNFK